MSRQNSQLFSAFQLNEVGPGEGNIIGILSDLLLEFFLLNTKKCQPEEGWQIGRIIFIIGIITTPNKYTKNTPNRQLMVNFFLKK